MKTKEEFMEVFLNSKIEKGLRPGYLSKKTHTSFTEAVEYLLKLVEEGKLVQNFDYSCPRCSHNLIVSFDDNNEVIDAECGVCGHVAEEEDYKKLASNIWCMYCKPTEEE